MSENGSTATKDATETPSKSPPSSPPQTSPPPEEVIDKRASLDPDIIVIPKRGRSGTKSPRRGSHTFLMGDDIVMQLSGGRRLSSFCTTSSNEETAISMAEDQLTEEEINETIRAHKQIITNMKSMQWPMHRKLKVLKRAKHYIKRHEGELKQSKQAKDVVAKYRVYVERSINRFKREFANFIVVITPWEMRIKKIESHFGSGVASYFIFLRWVFWVNIFISVFICAFIMVPEVLRRDEDITKMRKHVGNEKDREEALKFQSIWEFEGHLKYSPIFYGYYSNREMTNEGYRLPLAYFLTSFALYMFSFFCILRKMAQNARMQRISSKEDECTFCWKLYTGWDYMIGNSETAYNKVASLVMGFKESILEEKEKKKEGRNWKNIGLRILANILVLLLLASSAYGVVLVVDRSQNLPPDTKWFRANEVTIIVAGIGIVFPNIFDVIGGMEAYHPRIALRWQLGRILILNFLNLYTLMFSLFGKVDTYTTELSEMKHNITLMGIQTLTTYPTKTVTNVKVILVKRSPLEGREIPTDYDETGIHYMGLPVVNDPYKKSDAPLRMDRIEGRLQDGTTTTETEVYTLVVTTEDPGGGDQDINYEEELPANTVMYEISDQMEEQEVTSVTSTTTEKISDRMDTTTVASTTTTKRSMTTSKKPKYKAKNTTLSNIEYAKTTTVSATVASMPKTTEKICDDNIKKKITDDDLIRAVENGVVDKDKLRNRCWETMFGQELVKLTIMDLVMTVAATLITDLLRAVIVRYCNDCGCIFWDLEKKFPGYGDFKIAENILHLVNNQGMIWLGMFFSPGLPAINTFKLVLLMYLRSWAVLTCNIPHEAVFKASGSNNFYYALLLFILFLCTLPVGYAVVWLEPSWHCGPFSEYPRIYKILTLYIESKLPNTINKVVDYLTSPGAVIPLLLLMILIIYYLISNVSSLKDANKDLKSQIRKEKDVSEVGNVGLPMITSEVFTEPQPEKKHVRIKEEVFTTDSDKAKLIQTRVNSTDSNI